jgi:hypothetical protein
VTCLPPPRAVTKSTESYSVFWQPAKVTRRDPCRFRDAVPSADIQHYCLTDYGGADRQSVGASTPKHYGQARAHTGRPFGDGVNRK